MYFEEALESIEETAANNYPRRAHLLRQAFAAHRRGEYGLSIPVFLAQTDGICTDVTGGELFRSSKGRPRTAGCVANVQGEFHKALLSPLDQKIPLNLNKEDRGVGFGQLNRHMVLHGESLDYDTRTNGLRAVSLINYVVEVFGLDDGQNTI